MCQQKARAYRCLILSEGCQLASPPLPNVWIKVFAVWCCGRTERLGRVNLILEAKNKSRSEGAKHLQNQSFFYASQRDNYCKYISNFY